MTFDINAVTADMLSAIKTTAGANIATVQTTAQQFLARDKERLQQLAELRITGEISQQKFESRLADEKLVVEAELCAITVITKAIAQRAANAAIEVLEKAVIAVIR